MADDARQLGCCMMASELAVQHQNTCTHDHHHATAAQWPPPIDRELTNDPEEMMVMMT